jgi:hypothetical protein
MGKMMALGESAEGRSYVIHINEYSFKGPLFKGRKYEALTQTSSEGRVRGDKEAKQKKGV